MGFLQDKKFLIVGVASNRSIAYGVAKAMHREGAQLAFTYQGEKLKGRVEKFAGEFDSELVYPLDVGSDEEIDQVFSNLGQQWDGLDGIVHSVGFAPREQLEGDYVAAVTREGFRIAHDISAYSFAALAKAGREMMQGRNAALVTMSYLGAVRTVPNYNVMGVAKAALEASVRYMADSLGPEGIRVNAVGPGTIETKMSEAVTSDLEVRDRVLARTPLGRLGKPEEIAAVAAWLASDQASYITGQTIYADGGRMSLNLTREPPADV